MPVVRIPAYGWKPRQYQRPAWNAVLNGTRRIALAWHRRAGKDDLCLRAASHRMLDEEEPTKGNVWFMLPEASQARKAIWEAVNPDTGRKRVDEAFPSEIVKSRRNSDMFLELVNGTTFQVVGSDNWNSLVGSPPVGLIYSEYAISDPASWAYLRPILLENNGWMMANSTVRGHNHFKDFMDQALANPDWFAQILPATVTSVFTAEQLEQERREYIAENGPVIGQALFEQEYLCSFDAAVIGAYFADLVADAEERGRITSDLHYDPRKPMITAWDLGYANMAVWAGQQNGNRIDWFRFLHGSGQGVEWYIDELRSEGFRNFGKAYLPHDANTGEAAKGNTPKEVLEGIGIECYVPTPDERLSVQDGIGAVRGLFPRFRFHKAGCDYGIKALRQYSSDYDTKLRTVKPTPKHDWASHPADAMRSFAVGYREPIHMSKTINYARMSIA